MSAEQLEILWKVALAIFAAGGFWNELKAIRKDIKRLEIKQDKYNTLQERMLKQEMWKIFLFLSLIPLIHSTTTQSITKFYSVYF